MAKHYLRSMLYENWPKNINLPNSEEEFMEALKLMLCGQANIHLAENPFSKEFLENVAYNTPSEYYALVYLQLSYVKKRLA